MSHAHPIWLEAQRKRFTRPDAYRFARPGTPEAKPPGTLHPSARIARAEEAKAAADQAERDAFERELLELRWELKKLKLELALRRIRHKYSPDQPRVPAGSAEGGQWTSGGGANVSHDISQDPDDGRSDDLPAPRTRIAQNDAPSRAIDLHEERQLGGHAIEGHVGKSHEFLLATARRRALAAEEKGDLFSGLRVGIIFVRGSGEQIGQCNDFAKPRQS